MLEGKTIGIIGVGNMGEAIVRGLKNRGAEGTIIYDVRAARREYVHNTYGVKVAADNYDLAEKADIIIVAVKPQDAKTVLEELCPSMSASKLLISIAAGISTEGLCSFLGAETRLIRVMPNVAAMVLESATALSRGSNASEEDLEVAREIFDTFGRTVVLPEALMDAVTGLSGSGPAYVAIFVEALADGGVQMGLPRKEAMELAIQTVLGTARLLLDLGEHPGVLKDKVTSPGGTTIAGIASLEERGFRGAVIQAVRSATRRSEELGKL